jgi:hypothetical protein
MELWRIWRPKYGTVFDEDENLKRASTRESLTAKPQTLKRKRMFPLAPHDYRSPRSGCEFWVNEAIIDFALGFAGFEGRGPVMPFSGCLTCNRESWRIHPG